MSFKRLQVAGQRLDEALRRLEDCLSAKSRDGVAHSEIATLRQEVERLHQAHKQVRERLDTTIIHLKDMLE